MDLCMKYHIGEYVIAEKREQGDELGRGGIYALQSLEHHLEPGGPDSLEGPPSGHCSHHNSSWWVSKEYARSAIQLMMTVDNVRNCS